MPYTTTTRAELRERLQDRYTDDAFWTTVDANDALNEALRSFNLFTGYWRGTATIATVAGTPFIAVPTASITYRTHVSVAGTVVTGPVSIRGLYRTRLNWRTETLTSGGSVPTVISRWAPVGLQQIAIWPLDPIGGTNLQLDGVRVTPVLAADGATVDLGEEVLHALLDEALWILGFKRPSLLPQLRPRHLAFLQACLLKNGLLRSSAYYRAQLGLDQQQRLKRLRVPLAEESSADNG